MKTVGAITRGRPSFRVDASMTVLQAARYMTEKKVGAVCVVDGNRLAGVLSERDLMSRVLASEKDPRTVRVADVMTKNLVIAEADETIEVCVERMMTAGVRHLPVVEKQKLLGMISIRDLLLQEVDEKEFEMKMMTTYIYSHSAAAE
jgi:CBS domain-containing protein